MLLTDTVCTCLLLLEHTDAIKERVRDLQLQRAKQHLLIHTVSGHQPLRHVTEGRIHQPLDHFNRQAVNTFPQRFFVNEAYWQRPDGPVFLFIGGEGPIFEFDVLAGTVGCSTCLIHTLKHQIKYRKISYQTGQYTVKGLEMKVKTL
uniref:Uncharacterized protein n=1 Tax=Seriola lalandi dorsalis TaxID=1841481 RepID=A0A3B4YV43_SERLL